MAFWTTQDTIVRLWMLALVALGSISLGRLIRLFRQLYRPGGNEIDMTAISRGEVPPERLARLVLGSRLRRGALADSPSATAAPREFAVSESAAAIVCQSSIRFQYLWAGCDVDVASVRRAIQLVLLLSMVMVAFDAFPLYHGCYNEGKVSGGYCMIQTAEDLAFLLGLGLSLAAILFVLSSWFERTLGNRKRCWAYDSAMLLNDPQNGIARIQPTTFTETM